MRDKKRSFSEKLFLIVKGIAMGAANKVPGVSGGVVAFVMNFYDEFIFSLQKVNKTAFHLLFTGRFNAFYKYINGTFLGLIALGTFISFFTISKGIDYLLIYYELNVWATFFGMILGSVFYINQGYGTWSTKQLFVLIIGIAIGLGVSIPEPLAENRNLVFVFICGMISTSGITLPGLSGSFLLMLLGNYVLLLVDAVNAFADTFSDIVIGDYSFTGNDERMDLLVLLAIFTTGSIAGLVTLSHILGFVLHRHKKTTYAIIIGFILGSLGVVWPWKHKILNPNGTVISYTRYLPDISQAQTLITLSFVVLGILSVVVIEQYGKRKQ